LRSSRQACASAVAPASSSLHAGWVRLMDAPELKGWKVQRQLDQERAQRIKAETEAPRLRLGLTTAQRMIAALRSAKLIGIVESLAPQVSRSLPRRDGPVEPIEPRRSNSTENGLRMSQVPHGRL
jgi:hypothetical protein